MKGSKDRSFAALKQMFSVQRGISLRTAQRHADKNHPDWQAFVGQQAVGAMIKPEKKMSAPQVAAVAMLNPNLASDKDAPPEVDDDDSLPEPLRIRAIQWRIYKIASESWKAALRDYGALDARVAVLGLSTIKAMEAYRKAQAQAEQYEVSMRTLIPSSEFQATLPLLNSVFAIVRNMPAEVAMQANSTSPGIARAAHEDWLRNQFGPAARELVEKWSQYAPTTTAA
jgi:hypothetical protein